MTDAPPRWVDNPRFHNWTPTRPVTSDQDLNCRHVFPDGQICGRGKGADDHTAAQLPAGHPVDPGSFAAAADPITAGKLAALAGVRRLIAASPYANPLTVIDRYAAQIEQEHR